MKTPDSAQEFLADLGSKGPAAGKPKELRRRREEFTLEWVSEAWLAGMLATGAVLVATLMIVGTYRHFNQTSDESDHVGAGVEWLSKGTFTLDPIDPPLPRVSVALGPFLMGGRPTGQLNVWREGDRILHQRAPERMLTAARLGTLPYFLLLVFLAWRRAKIWMGYGAAAACVWMLAFCPPLLGNAALATTDICFTAMYLLAIEGLWLVLEHPSRRNIAILGAATALAILTKLSALPFLGLSTIAAGFLFHRKYRRAPGVQDLAFFCGAAILVIGTGYRWVIGPFASHYASSQSKVDHLVAKAGPFRHVARFAVEHVPLAPFVQGLLALAKFGHSTRTVYFLGQNHSKGLFSFYLVVFCAKTPIPLLLLGLAGIVIAFRKRKGEAYTALALSAMFLPFLFASVMRVNIGLRHILVVYAFYAMFAAFSAKWLWEQSGRIRPYARGLLVLLFCWQAVTTMHASPDFLVYANEVAAPYAKSISIDSDYDWGQDLKRLIAELDRRRPEHIWIVYSGFAESDMSRLPKWHTLPDGQQVNGWIAISEQAIRRNPEKYGWLNQYKPVTEVGHTIRLYDLDPQQVPTLVEWDKRVEPVKPEDAF
jgi:hypothetical protein